MKKETGGACNRYGRLDRCIRGFGGRPEGKRPRGRSRHRWEGHIKVDLQEVGRWA